MARQANLNLAAKDISRLTSSKAVAFGEEYFCNHALFADHFLLTRLRDDPAWRDNPAPAFQQVRTLMRDARSRWLGQGEHIVRRELYEPLFDLLGFKATVNKKAGENRTTPNYRLSGREKGTGSERSEVPVPFSSGRTAAFVYAWDRWLDGPDFNLDQETPEENPGACVVTALEEGVADWIIVTNGRQWRLYSRRAHSRATNFYEVDLAAALVASGDTDPNEAFRYWWLFFRAAAFSPLPLGEGPGVRAGAGGGRGCWLDSVAEAGRDYAKQIGQRLKNRIFVEIFPHLAQGFLDDRTRRLGTSRGPDDGELTDIHQATLTLLYRLLFLLYAESRDLLPIREAPYRAASLKTIKEEIAEKAGVAESEMGDRIAQAYSATETTLYDRLTRLCKALDQGEPALNVPACNGGLFVSPDPLGGTRAAGRGEGAESREHRIAEFLGRHKVPDRYLALAIDRLARDPDDKTFSLAFIDYKSLEVRHLGSIYEGLLEFNLKIAEQDLTTKTEGRREKYIPLDKAKPKRGKQPDVAVRKGHVYLSNDKAERKAGGSYYTPDPIVEYIVQRTVGPVLAEKLETLRPEFCKVRKTFDRELVNARDPRIHQSLPSPSGRGAGGEGSEGERSPHPSPLPKGEGTNTRHLRQEAADKTYAAYRELVDALFDFRTLDPAMGSGHFLVEAVDFITDRMLAFLNQFPVNPVSFMLDRTRRDILEALAEQGVSVDPDKLTEVHLLKRHVLKRCIYGVDLNPMAVELAKVSLWLDAFTIGAPLSFLDHHLRCGNSLVGATLQDFGDATRATAQGAAGLFGIDYEPLLTAVRHVIQVNKTADATVAEARRSAGEYSAARRDLSGYRVVLNLLTAKHFGYREAPGLLAYGSELDFSGYERFVGSLVGAVPAKKGEKPPAELVAEVESLANSRDLRFFHWELEFPEVFFGFEDADQRRTRPKNKIAPGSAGFDSVIGNPPYLGVRTGSLSRAFADYAITRYQSAERNWDLFALFIETSLRLVKRRFGLGLIVPSRLSTNRDFAPVRRDIFAAGGPTEIIECGAAFEDPSMLASIVIARAPPDSPLVRIGHRAGGAITVDRTLPRNVLQGLPDQPFVSPLLEKQLPVFVSLSKVPLRLGAIAEITRGMECGKNDPHVRQKDGMGTRPVISGEGVREFLVAPQGLYMPDNLGPASKYKPRLFSTVPRLLLRFVAPYPVAAVDRTGFLNFNTVYNIVLRTGGLDEYAALACLLNSNAVRWWFTTAFNAHETLFPHIQKYQLANVPVPAIDLNCRVIRQLASIGRAAIEGRVFSRERMEQLSLEAFDIAEFAHLIPEVSKRREFYAD